MNGEETDEIHLGYVRVLRGYVLWIYEDSEAAFLSIIRIMIIRISC